MNSDNVETATEVLDELKSSDTLPQREVEPAEDTKQESQDAAQEVSDETANENAESEQDEADSASKSKRLPKWLKKTLAETHAEKRELKERLRELENQLKAREQPVVERELTLEDFDYDQVAYAKHVAKEAAKQAIREQEEARRQEVERKQVETQRKAFASKVAELEAEVGVGAWEEVCTAPINTTPEMLDFVNTSDHGVKVAYYLSQNIDEAERIAGLPKYQQYRYLAEIEERLSKPAKPEPRVTKAPPPPPTVKGASSPPKSPDDPNLSTAERIALWRAQKNR